MMDILGMTPAEEVLAVWKLVVVGVASCYYTQYDNFIRKAYFTRWRSRVVWRRRRRNQGKLSLLPESLEKILTTTGKHNFCLGLAATPELLWCTQGCVNCSRWWRTDSTSQADPHKKARKKGLKPWKHNWHTCCSLTWGVWCGDLMRHLIVNKLKKVAMFLKAKISCGNTTFIQYILS